MTIIKKGRHVLGKLSRNGDMSSPRNCEAALTWELRDNDGKIEFSACGELWNHLKTGIVWGGQCVDQLARLFPRDKMAQRIRETWAAYHLNSMKAGTPEQMAHVRKTEAQHNYDYVKVCDVLREAGLYEVPVTDELREAAAGDIPEDWKTYRYGTSWLHSAIPADVIELIKRGFQDAPEWAGDMAGNAPALLTADPDEAGDQDRDLIAEAGLTIKAEFVPFSRSRNKGEKQPSLNWLVTLQCKGRDVLTCDYSAGSAHCPADKRKWSEPNAKREAIRLECETGKTTREVLGRVSVTGAPITPKERDVISSLLMDCDALDCASFADWCSDLGFDADSIKARTIYNTCMAHAVAIRAAVGGEMFEALRAGNQ